MRKYIPLLISGLLMIFVGLYMLTNPDGFLTVVISVFGIYLAFEGVKSIFSYFSYRDSLGRRLRSALLAKAAVNIALGLITVIIAAVSPSLIPTVIIYLAAAAFILDGAVDLLDLMSLSKLGITVPALGLETLLSFVFALILFLFPRFLTGIVMTLFAAVLFASGVLMIYGSVSSMIYARKLRKMGGGDVFTP